MPEKVTEEQAGEALSALLAQSRDPDQDDEQETAAVIGDPSADEPAPAETPEGTEQAEGEEAAPTDDVVSLRAKLADSDKRFETERKSSEDRVRAIQERSSQNNSIVRDRYLRKANAASRALQVLEAARTEKGVSQEEVDRAVAELRGTMNPNSPSYQPAPDNPGAASAEDQAMVLNDFLNEKQMSRAEAEVFGQWMRTEAGTVLSDREQALAGRDVEGFLRLAHTKYLAGQSTDRDKQRREAVEATRTVQRTQKEAARAASAAPAAPRKQNTSASAKQIDVRKLTKDDVSSLLRQSVEQYR